MTKLPITKVLLILLVVQGAILCFKNSSASILQVDSTSSQFVKIVPEAVKKIKIEQPDKSLELEKTADGWLMPSAENFPADSLKIDQLLHDLQALKATSPVATSLSAAKKLKTGVTGFEKKLTLVSEDGEEVIFLGSSPTFKKLYARVNGSDNTYIVDYQAAELSPSTTSWFSADVLKIQPKELELVEFKDIVLEQSDGILGFATIPENKEVDRKELQGFVNKLTEIAYSEIPLKVAPAGWEQAATVVSYDLMLKGAKQNYLIKGPIKQKVAEKDVEKYFLKAAQFPFYFELSKYEVDALTAFTLDKMLKDKTSVVPATSTEEKK